MSFMMKKKKYKFQVEFNVEELLNVPLISGMLFTKVRLLDGGSFSDCTDSAEVVGHSVHWKKNFNFHCRLVSSASSGILEPCICRVSVRKETKGGKSFQKLGYADINIALFAGAGKRPHRCLLNGYDTKHRREDNSTLKISVQLTMLKGDPCFKVPNSVSEQFVDDCALHEGNRVKNQSEDSNPSASSGLTSVDWNIQPEDQLTPTLNEDIFLCRDKDMLSAPGHSRNASTVSSQSKMSGLIGSVTSSHSRQPSSDSFQLKLRTNTCGSADIGLMGSLRTHQKKQDDTLDIVDGVLRIAGFSTSEDTADEASRLHLAVPADGKTVLPAVKSVTTCHNSGPYSLRQ